MSQLTELNQEYLALAEAGIPSGTTEREFFNIVDYMKNSSAIHHGEYVRTCYAPKLFTEHVFDTLKSDVKLLYGIFEKMIAAYYADPAYRALFGFDERMNELILHDRNWRAAPLPMARIDIFYNDETGDYKFCEFNTDGSSAMIEDREMNLAQRLSGAYRTFGKQHACRTGELFDSWVDAFCGVYRRRRDTAALPRVAIVDYMECGTINEFEAFRERFEARGIEAEVCDVRYLHYDGHTLTGADGERIDAIYRRAVTRDVMAHWEDSQALLRAVKDDAVVLIGDFHTQIVHNKMLFYLMHHPATQTFLSDREKAYISAHVPYTATLADADFAALAAEKDAWILKPKDSYGSRGIHAGVESTPEQWSEILHGLDNPADRENYIRQEFYTPYVTENYGLVDGAFQRARYYNLTGIYVYDGRPAGIYSRVSLSPIISTQYSEKALPTLFVQI